RRNVSKTRHHNASIVTSPPARARSVSLGFLKRSDALPQCESFALKFNDARLCLVQYTSQRGNSVSGIKQPGAQPLCQPLPCESVCHFCSRAEATASASSLAAAVQSSEVLKHTSHGHLKSSGFRPSPRASRSNETSSLG